MTAGSDRTRFWFWDPSHFPRPVSTAAESFDLPAMAAGFAAAAAELRRALPAQYIRVERGYVYFGVDLPAGPEELARREAAYAATVGPLVETALAAWTDRYLPEARRLNERMRALADPTLPDTALAEGLDTLVALRTRQWAIHDLALVPAMEAVARFTARYGELLGGPLGTQALVQGFANEATQAAEALDALAAAIRERPALATALLSGRGATPLGAGSDDGRWFRQALGEYLERYGGRTQGWDVGEPTWREDPRPVLGLLQERLRRPPVEPGAHRRQAAEQRERALADALAHLPEVERPSFMRALRAAQAYPVVSEDHNAVIDQEGLASLRAVLLEAGRRLQQHGRLAAATDAVWLTRRELQDALRGGDLPATRAAARRAWQRRRLRITPPRTLGPPLPDWAASNATLADFFGLGGEPVHVPGELRGVGVSAGRVSGRAAVIRTLDEVERLAPGEILVCPMTSPAWTPWLSLIAGAVVETGGMLSHTAVLAREYGIPCVVNVRGATDRIPHGATIEVDGDTGAVRWSPTPR